MPIDDIDTRAPAPDARTPDAKSDSLPTGRREAFRGVAPYRRRYKQLERLAEDYFPLWRRLNEYLYPWSGHYLYDDEAKQKKVFRGESVQNSMIFDAIRTCASGLHGSLTSPARPWWEMTVPAAGEAGSVSDEVKRWLHAVTEIMRHAMAKSNLYSVLPGNIYPEELVYGPAVGIIDPNDDVGFIVRPLTIGEYFLANGDDMKVDTVYRRFQMTVAQLRQRFGDDNPGYSQAVKDAMASPARQDDDFRVIHAMQPCGLFGGAASRRWKYESVYFLDGGSGDEDAILEWQGHRGKPFIAVRWGTIGDDPYGHSPGMMALADDKMLQTMEFNYIEAAAKTINPVLAGPAALERRMRQGGFEPGEYVVDDAGGTAANAVRPLYQVNYDFNTTRQKIGETSNQIQTKFFNNLWLSVLFNNKQMTAAEVAQRFEEKATLLGPVQERNQSELFDPLLERIYSILNHEYGVIPQPPEELSDGQALKIVYIGQLSQTVKMAGITNIITMLPIFQNINQLDPSAAVKFNGKKMYDYIATNGGLPPDIINSDEECAEIEAAMAQAQQQAAMPDQMKTAADAAKSMSQADMTGDNGLTRMMGVEPRDDAAQ